MNINGYDYYTEREKDILKRGENQLVHDYDGNIKPLKHCHIWFSQDGNYMPPRTFQEPNECDVCEMFNDNVYQLLLYLKNLIDCSN